MNWRRMKQPAGIKTLEQDQRLIIFLNVYLKHTVLFKHQEAVQNHPG